MRNGPVVFLLALGVAGLAVGGAVALHGGLPEANPSPSSTPSPSPSQAALSDDICVLMDDMVAVSDDLSESAIDGELLMDDTTWDDPALLDAINESGQDMIDATVTMSAYIDRAAELATDSDAVAAFKTLAQATTAMGEHYGNLALEAESVEAYVSALFADIWDDELNTLMSEGDAANIVAGKYVLDTCGRDILGSRAAAGTAAKSDVSTLGKEMATYFVDWDGVTQPVITVTDGEYYLNGVYIGEQTPGIALTDQYAHGSRDWCVEVSSEAAPTEVYTYSAQEGLQQGTCASLTP